MNIAKHTRPREASHFVESDTATWSESDYYRLLDEFSSLFNTPRHAPEASRYEALADLIEAYEDVHYPMREPSEDTKGDAVNDREGILVSA